MQNIFLFGEFHRQKKNDGFPCSFPIEIPKRVIEAFTNENDIVLDPFMGSGTTAIAAKELNRKYIGFDISNKYCQMSEERINNF